MTTPHDPYRAAGQPSGQDGSWSDPQQAGQADDSAWQQPGGPDRAEQPTQQFGSPQQYGQPEQYGQPQSGQPGQYGQPQYGQPQYGQPEQYGQPPYGQPQYGPADQYGQPQYGQPQQDFGVDTAVKSGGPAGGTPRNKGVLVTAVAVVVALLAGLGIYFFAVRDSSGGGQASPQAAVTQLFADLDNGDLVGLTDTFDPVEARFVNDFGTDLIGHFKRLGLLTDDATVNNATGANISIKGITFDTTAEEKPLTDLTIVKLTGGTLTLRPTSGSGVETDLFKRLIAAISDRAADADIPMTSTTEPTVIDIAQVIRDDNNGEPIRISTVQRDGNWYPSLFYTLADYWAQATDAGTVTAADALPAVGADRPEAAVDAMVRALIAQDATAVIGLLPPDEMAAVHAYGRKIVAAIDAEPVAEPDVSLQAEWNVSDVTGGKLLSIRTLEFTAGGESGRIEIDQAANSITVINGSDVQTFDVDTIAELIGTQELADVHPNMTDFVQRMLSAAVRLGIVATQVDDRWYVSPLRSYSGLFTTLLGGMEQRDFEMFIDLLQE